MTQLLFDGGLNVTSLHNKPLAIYKSRRSKNWHQSWKCSRESPLSTVQEICQPTLLPNKPRRKSQDIRRSITTSSLAFSPITENLHRMYEDTRGSHEKISQIQEGKTSLRCPIAQEFRQAKAHHPVLASTGCTRDFCQAGRAVHTDEPRIGENRAIEVVEQEAKGFLGELYREKFFDTEESFTDRLNAVLAEIRSGASEGKIRETRQRGIVGGSWVQTPAELEFGIRRAWRNARKCIMRSHCEELK